MKLRHHDLIVRHLAIGILVSGLHGAFARDDGRYANSSLKPWFDKLRSGNGLCCSDADGNVVLDADWESVGDHYRVRINDVWYDVPEAALVKGPNLFGRTMVWPSYFDGVLQVRCFLPGAAG